MVLRNYFESFGNFPRALFFEISLPRPCGWAPEGVEVRGWGGTLPGSPSHKQMFVSLPSSITGS